MFSSLLVASIFLTDVEIGTLKGSHAKPGKTEHWPNVQVAACEETHEDWKAVVAWRWAQREGGTERGGRNPLEVMETFHILTPGVVSQMSTTVKIHRIVDIK